MRWLLIVGLIPIGIAIFLSSNASLKLRVALELMGWQGILNIARESAANRILGAKQTHSRLAYHRFLDALSEIDLQYCVPQRRVLSEQDIADCHRMITHLVTIGFRLYYETDLERPHFIQMVEPRIKVLGDNPDAYYYSAALNTEGDYLMKGRKNNEVYFSVTIYEAPCSGCFSSNVIADINHENIKYEKDGSFEFLITSRNVDEEKGYRNVLSYSKLTKGNYPQLITRHYYEDEKCAQLNQNIHIALSIESLKPNLPLPNRISDVETAERFERVINFVKSHTLGMQQDPSKAPSWFSFTPNVFGPAVLFRNETVGLGAVDIVYSAGPFKFENPDEEGLLITGVMPDCSFANIVLWNVFLQSFGYETGKKVSLNRKQMKSLNGKLEGPYQILLSKHLPPKGLPKNMDWLDSEGRKEGSMFWRFLLAKHDVNTPKAKIVKLNDL